MIGLVVALLLVAGLIAAYAANREQQALLSITNFDECVAAGNPVMESYPEQCRTPDGRTFVNERQAAPVPNIVDEGTTSAPVNTDELQVY